jgi:hypothetical protein
MPRVSALPLGVLVGVPPSMGVLAGVVVRQADGPVHACQDVASGFDTYTRSPHGTVGFMMDDAAQTYLLLREIYRLGRADEAVAVQWFQELLRSGYTPDIHRSVLIDIDARGLRRMPR